MQLSTKHPAGQLVEYADFTGGLNTAISVESIGQNELAVAVNVEIDKATGLLRTSYGFDRVAYDSARTFDRLMHDKAGKTLVVTDTSGNVYRFSSGNLVLVGKLTGTSHARCAQWEDGLVIASGGRLQYLHGGTLETISESPARCSGVIVREGRIWTWNAHTIYMSDIGYEHGWKTDTNVASSAQWIEVGYKDTGDIVDLVPTLSTVLVFKDSGYLYRVDGQFPGWSATQIASQVYLDHVGCAVPIGPGIVALGHGKLFSVAPSNEYGEAKAQAMSDKVDREIGRLGADAFLRYVPEENSLWMVSARNLVLVFDISAGAFFYRRYSSAVRDVVCMGKDIYTLREHSLCKQNSNALLLDEGEAMPWAFECKALASQNYLLLKRIIADTTPLFSGNTVDQRFWVGGAMLKGSVPHEGTLWDKEMWSKSTLLTAPLETEPTGENKFSSFFSDAHAYIDTPKTYRAECRCVERRRCLRVRAEGSGGATIFNRIAMDVAEV